ncbi:hypothetical protein [Paucibacter sp. DJ2R-2]|uniref:hypothetical protein n=1 Tax=Paucibacter sp. DJ2R-2 TaxID=2893558 RepID=UPI0021E4DFB4|nr:hypothetical protein [Paucibacter sp. DJ2R-2]MCV2419613.1 hypothetical protein [Paucibacter sp. DJ4R-1]MCV2437483.1 hypothetical protein [Paucibacter sp. DJ2R-2]
MTPLFKKLNLGQQRQLTVLNAPASFEPELSALLTQDPGLKLQRQAHGPVRFALSFAITEAELDAACRALLPLAEGDALIWIAYPKQSSKRLRGEFHRDSDWALLRAAGFDTVRQVAIDEDWSALRFRRQQYIG